MKNLDLGSIGVHEMDTLEMQSTDGGVVLIILAVCAVALTLPLCTTYNDMIIPLPVDLAPKPSSGESIDLAKRYNMPIGY